MDVTGLIRYFSLSESPESWADAALDHLEKVSESKKSGTAKDYRQLLKDAGFDVTLEQKKLNDLYHELAKERK